MKKIIRKKFSPSQYSIIDFDSIEASEKAVKIMRSKKCLNDIYSEMYHYIMNVSDRKLTSKNKDIQVLEIGSGGGFIKDLYPNVITSDIKPINNVDMIINAETLPFENSSLDKILAVHVIHHIPDIEQFLSEALRVLKLGGGLVCIEPYWSPMAKFLYKNVHPEPFDINVPNWNLKSSGPMSGSNQALSYILLKRDKEIFNKKFPQFEIIRLKRFGFIRYFCTGGIWLKQKLPDFCFKFLKAIELLLKPLMPLLAIHHAFILKKISNEING